MEHGKIHRKSNTAALVIRSSVSHARPTVPSSFQESGGKRKAPDESEESTGSPKRRKRVFVCVKPSKATFPASLFTGNSHPLPRTPEQEAVKRLRQVWQQQHPDGQPEYIILDLTDFTCYLDKQARVYPTTDHSFEMQSLDSLRTKPGLDHMLFDGVLSCGDVSLYVEGGKFSTVAVEGYGDETQATVDSVSIQSDIAAAIDDRIWYRLKAPSPRYKRFHEPFLWIVDLGKHFVDYITHKPDATLRHFRHDFHGWLKERYQNDATLTAWLSKTRSDFRCAINAYQEWLWKEYYSLAMQSSDYPRPWGLRLWDEIKPDQLCAIPRQPIQNLKTTVTPFVYYCFKNMFFSHLLHVPNQSDEVAKAHIQHIKSMGFSPSPYVASTHKSLLDRSPPQTPPSPVKIGDVVGVPRDAQTRWKNDGSQLWYAYVQDIRPTQKSGNRLDIIWLYRPSDTTLGNMFYPFENELFISDNCNCGDGVFKESDVVCKLDVEWQLELGRQAKGVFVRQKYTSEEQSFVTIKSSDFKCHHKTGSLSTIDRVRRDYKLGDPIYVRGKGRLSDVLEPAVLVAFTPDRDAEHVYTPDNDIEHVTVRRLLRRNRDLRDGKAAPNELVWTTHKETVRASRIAGKCHLQVFHHKDVEAGRIPTPYTRGGTGHAWFITHQLAAKGSVGLQPFDIQRMLDKGPVELQPFDVTSAGTSVIPFRPSVEPTFPRLKGLDLFSGGGNFGRGIEEGGAVEMQWVVEIDGRAIHTYRANLLKDPNTVCLFLGSVDDFLDAAMRGPPSKLIAKIGEVQFICGGSPCRAFSTAQQLRTSMQSIKNASLVASVAAFIDLYRPQWAILENVTGMAHAHEAFEGQNVFSQLLCALVSIGYQVGQFNLDAHSSGAPQSRSRLLISITSPGLQPMENPRHSHEHPPGARNLSLGKTANGLPFGARLHGPTPFAFVSAEEATRDLPDLYDGRTACIAHPDHRSPKAYNYITKEMLKMIPVNPVASSFQTAKAMGKMATAQLEATNGWRSKARVARTSKSYTRIHPLRLIPAITRTLNPADGHMGQVVHWREPRTISVMEARRAQGVPDHEVLIGRCSDQWAIVGDAVSRHVALALGLSLREAWLSEREKLEFTSRCSTALQSHQPRP